MADEPTGEQFTNPAATGSTNAYLIPGAIVLAGIFIAGAVVFTQGAARGGDRGGAQTGTTIEAKVLPITEADYILGPADPDVYLIEYVDFQCPYCDQFHTIVKEVLKKHEGRIAWVMRNFPLDSIHPEARPAAIAAGCAAKVGGNEAFWSFADQVFANQRSLGADAYKRFAQKVGVDAVAFDACVAAGDESTIDAHLKNAIDLGGNGTPYTVLLTKKGDVVKFSGALPVDRVEVLVNRALASLGS